MNTVISSSQLKLVIVGICILCAIPFPPHLQMAGCYVGITVCLWDMMLRRDWNIDSSSTLYPIDLLLRKHEADVPVRYVYPSDTSFKASYIQADAWITVLSGVVFYMVASNYQGPKAEGMLPLLYTTVMPAMYGFKSMKNLIRPDDKVVYGWYSNQTCINTQFGSISSNESPQGYIFWELPAMVMHKMSQKVNVWLVCNPADADQGILASAISERRASLYLVSTDAVIPVCYNPEENEQAIAQLRTETFQRDIPVVTLDVNPMPVPASNGILAVWAVGLLAGFYFLLGYLYYLAHGNPQVTKQILPLISFLCTWGVLEVYSLVLRHKGQSRLRKAAGL